MAERPKPIVLEELEVFRSENGKFQICFSVDFEVLGE
jgi:hypothetical protein